MTITATQLRYLKAAADYEDARQKAAHYGRLKQEAKDALMLGLTGPDPLEGDLDGGIHVRAVAVRPEIKVINETDLRKALAGARWNRIAPRRLDTEILTREIDARRISAALVERYTETKYSSPYPRVTIGRALGVEE